MIEKTLTITADMISKLQKVLYGDDRYTSDGICVLNKLQILSPISLFVGETLGNFGPVTDCIAEPHDCVTFQEKQWVEVSPDMMYIWKIGAQRDINLFVNSPFGSDLQKLCVHLMLVSSAVENPERAFWPMVRPGRRGTEFQYPTTMQHFLDNPLSVVDDEGGIWVSHGSDHDWYLMVSAIRNMYERTDDDIFLRRQLFATVSHCILQMSQYLADSRKEGK